MDKTSENVYSLLPERNFHGKMEDLKVPYIVVGGVGSQALINADEIDWDNRTVYLSSDAYMSCRRDNSTVRDLDALVKSTSKATAKAYQQKISGIVGDKLVISTFKLSPYEENVHGRFDFSGDRYVDSEGHLYWRLGGIETEIPVESLEQWLVKRGDETVCAVPNPVAQLGAYGCRSITGWRPKDREKVGKLVKIITPNRKISDIPAEYRGQYRAFREQYKKVAAARKKLGFFGVRADFLSLVENQPQFVEFAQGPLEGVLSRAVRRV